MGGLSQWCRSWPSGSARPIGGQGAGNEKLAILACIGNFDVFVMADRIRPFDTALTGWSLAGQFLRSARRVSGGILNSMKGEAMNDFSV